MSEIVLVPLDEDDEATEISLGEVDLGDGFVLTPTDDGPRERRRGSGGIRQPIPDEGFLGHMNRGIIGSLLAPFEAADQLINAPTRALTRGAPEEFTQGPTGMVADLFSRAGGAIAPADADPRQSGLGAEVGRFLGDTLGMAPATLGAIGAVPARIATNPNATQGGARIAQEAANMMNRATVSRPGLSATAEIAAGVGGGLGGAYARNQFGDDAEAVGQVVGALGLPAAPAAATAAARGIARQTPMLGGIMDRVQAAASGEGYATMRARETLRAEASDADAALQNLYRGFDGSEDPKSLLDLSPALMSRDPGLIRLQERVGANNEQIRAALRARERDNMQQAQDLLRTNADGKEGSVAFARESATQAVDDHISMINNRISVAMDDAAQAVAAAGPRSVDNRADASKIVSDGIESVYAQTRNDVNFAWSQVPQDDNVVLNNLRSTYETIVNDAGLAQSGDIPARARQLLDPNAGTTYGEAEAGKEVFGFYSAMKEAARGYRAEGRMSAARYAEQLADAALRDIDVHTTTSEAYKNARAASLALHDRFTRGPIGKLRGYGNDGGRQVSEYEVLDRLLGRSGGAERTNLEALEAALGINNPGPYRAAEDYVRASFADNLSKGGAGAYSPASAANYIQKHNELFERYPAMRDMFDDVLDRVTRAQALEKDGLRDASNVQTRSPEGRFSNSAVDREFDAILSAEDPVAEVRALSDVLNAQDPTGRATEGLRQSAREYIVTRILGTDRTLGPVMRGTAAESLLRKRRNVFAELLGPEEMAKIDAVASELRLLDQTQGTTPQSGALVQPSLIGQLTARVFGLRAIGGQLQGQGIGSFQQNAIISNLSRKIADSLSTYGAERLIMEAMKPGNEAILRALLTKPSTVDQASRAARSVEAWVSTLPVSILGAGPSENDTSDQELDALFEGLGVTR